jgi:hypothetical protein
MQVSQVEIVIVFIVLHNSQIRKERGYLNGEVEGQSHRSISERRKPGNSRRFLTKMLGAKKIEAIVSNEKKRMAIQAQYTSAAMFNRLLME